jgi:hypothetical protein
LRTGRVRTNCIDSQQFERHPAARDLLPSTHVHPDRASLLWQSCRLICGQELIAHFYVALGIAWTLRKDAATNATMVRFSIDPSGFGETLDVSRLELSNRH